MALTVSQTPQAYTPAYNEQTFVALSNQIAVSDFYYLVQFQVGGSIIYTKKILQRPDGYCVFDAIEVVKNYIKHSFNPTVTAVTYATDSAVAVTVYIKEFYSNAVQSTYTYNYVAWNACLDSDTFSGYDYRNYVSNDDKIYLLSPNTTEYLVPNKVIDIKADNWMHFFKDVYYFMDFYLYTPSGTLKGSVNKTFPTGAYIHYVNAGKKVFDGSGVTVNVGDRLDVKFQSFFVNTIFSFYFTEVCSKSVQYNVYYYKRNGGIGFKTFELVSQETMTKKTNTVRMNTKTLTAGVYSAPTYKREKNVVSTTSQKSITLNTNWITEQQAIELNELFDSPLVWLQLETGEYKPISITDNSYKFSKHVNDKLFNYSITAEYDNTETRQRGI
jgi:hypothetical protein